MLVMVFVEVCGDLEALRFERRFFLPEGVVLIPVTRSPASVEDDSNVGTTTMGSSVGADDDVDVDVDDVDDSANMGTGGNLEPLLFARTRRSPVPTGSSLPWERAGLGR